MAASSTCKALTVCNLGVTLARCTGFTKIHGQNDYSFIIDIEWTDDRSQPVKRTFSEFQKFHQDLLRLFPELKRVDRSKLHLRTSIRDNVAGLFTKDKRGLAESREAILDNYLINLLRQPERIRHSKIILSFFEPRDSDPKPCKSSSPSEKSDSGIDLSDDRSQRQILTAASPPTQSIGVQHNGCEEIGIQCSPDEQYLDSNCGVQADSHNNQIEIDDDILDDYPTDDYETETETESDEDSYNEDYFLDVGYGDLMLQSQTSVEEEQSDVTSPVEPGNEKALWCSNLDKFSNILRSSMSNLYSISETQSKTYRTLTSIDEPDDLFLETPALQGDVEENSETESQQCGTEDRGLPISQSPIQSSEDECDTYKLSKTNLKNYYLSTNNLNNLE